MSIRLHLTPEDVTRIRFRPVHSVLDQVQEAVIACRPDGVGPLRLLGRPEVDPHLRFIGPISGTRGCSPGFLCSDFDEPDEAWDQLRSTPASIVEQDLADVQSQTGSAPKHLVPLLDPRSEVRLRLLAAYQQIYRHLILPYADVVAPQLQAHQRRLTETLLSGGVLAVLDTLAPAVVWRSPVLEVHVPSKVDIDVQLAGSGVTLLPALYRAGPAVQHDELTQETIVTYPVRAAREKPDVSAASSRLLIIDVLGPVLGDSRAMLLAELAGRPGQGTGGLAERLGIAAATTSEHLGALRRAGLVRTDRRSLKVAHHVTALGGALLRTALADDRSRSVAATSHGAARRSA